MCRLYGFRANEATKVECTLVQAQNALMIQSRSDLRGEAHEDGWGIGYYDDTGGRIEKRMAAAHADLHFSVTAERVYTKTVVAHVRHATVGANSLSNTHPFLHGQWVLAHNGTLRGFERFEGTLIRETDPKLLSQRLGETDSELAFYWLLTRLAEGGIALDSPCANVRRAVEVIGEAILILDRLSAAHTDEPARLNFLLTDGSMLLASRWRNTLHWASRDGVRDCEICGIPHVQHHEGTRYRAAVIASEPISHETWHAVPEASILAVDGDLRADVYPLGNRVN